MSTERARFLSIGEESEVRMGADFIAGEISVLTTPLPHTYPGIKDPYLESCFVDGRNHFI